MVDILRLLNSIHPPMYNYLPLIVIFVFEIAVVGIELFIFILYEDGAFKKKEELNDDEVFSLGLKAIVVGNIVTFLIGMAVYLLIGGQL